MKTSLWTRAGVIAAVVLLGASLAHAQGDELLVTNVQAQQRPNTYLIDVTYNLETVGDISVMVRLYLSFNAGVSYPHLCQMVSGDIGIDVQPGTSRHIVWDSGTELPDFSCSNCQLRVTADDGVISIPAGFVYIPYGSFIMGSPIDEPSRRSNETQHEVTLTHGIYIQKTEITNSQYSELAQWAYDNGLATVSNSYLRDNLDGSTEILTVLASGYEITFNNGIFYCINPNQPAKFISWYGAVSYCDWLSLQQGLPRAYDHATWQCNGGSPYTAVGYRLPTEAEWEYTCRAGSVTAVASGPITYPHCDPVDPNLDEMGWYCGNTNTCQSVALKSSNIWDLYDMHGNAMEWCNDLYSIYGGAVTDPVGGGAGLYRVLRGGEWETVASDCRSARRHYEHQAYARIYFCFRPLKIAN